jgi:hypothetical protein
MYSLLSSFLLFPYSRRQEIRILAAAYLSFSLAWHNVDYRQTARLVLLPPAWLEISKRGMELLGDDSWRGLSNHQVWQELCAGIRQIYSNGAATLRWILLSKTVLAHIGAFLEKCTLKDHFHTMAIHEKSGTLWELQQSFLSAKKQTILQYHILAQNHACHVTQSGWINYLV